MHRDTLPYLAAPCCRTDLILSRVEKQDVHFAGEIYEGNLDCSSCRTSYRIRRGVPVFLGPLSAAGDDEERLVFRFKEIFDYLWSRVRGLPLDDFRLEEKFLEDVRIERGLFEGASVFEAGLGQGRFL